MYTVYVLRSLKDGRTYIGCTKDIENRIKEHNTGEVKSTKGRTPFVIWHKEDFIDKYEAFKREQHFKTAWERRQLRKSSIIYSYINRNGFKTFIYLLQRKIFP